MNKLPNKLTRLRKHYNYSQAQVAEVLGIDPINYMAFENGSAVCNFEQLKKLASFYRINVKELFINSSSVGLHNVKGPSGKDEYYFLPDRTFLEKIKKYQKIHPIRFFSLCLFILLIFIVSIYLLNYKEYVAPSLTNNNILAINDNNIYYIDGSKNVYTTSNSDEENIIYKADKGILKVVCGQDFMAVLKEDGTVFCKGLDEEKLKKINKWKDIVDIACGDHHLVALNNKGKVFAVGENDMGQCDVSSFKNIIKIYGFKKATVVEKNDGSLEYCGTFLGSSQIRNFKNPLDISSSNNYLMILNQDKTLEVISKETSILETNKWHNIIDIACGDTFLAALRSDGVLLVKSDDPFFESNVKTWKNIIAIASLDDYLIAYDGNKIYGSGTNDNFDFKQEYYKGTALPVVSNVKISIDNNIEVSFDSVLNASGYEISLLSEDNTVINKYRVTSNTTVSFSKDDLQNETTYNIVITTLGDGENYLNSEKLSVPFTYQDKENEETYIDLDFDYTKMTVQELENYLRSVGIENITPIEIKCDDDQTIITAVNGVSSGQRYARSELSKATVSYNYCKVGNEKQDALDN